MAPELKSNLRIAIAGGGPAGIMCAYYLKQSGYSPVVFEYRSPLKTLLPTGGGRCNLAHAEFDFRELAKNYPRGEKFLYSLFSKYGTAETIEFFEKIGIKTYTQDDCRIFPVSDSSADVRAKMLDSIRGVKIINEKVVDLKPCNGGYNLKTETESRFFEKVIIAVGGHAGFTLAENLGHTIIEPKPALTGLKTKENLKSLAGVSLKNVTASFGKQALKGDLLFTHEGVSGPLVFMISSLMARKDFPYNIEFDFAGEIELQEILNANPHKSLKNLLSDFVPKSYGLYVLEKLGISPELEACRVNGRMRDDILKMLKRFQVTIISTGSGGEVVTSGGVALNEINPKTMESKISPNIYFCGEVIDVDGLCGGFNLQNCWSTGFAAASAIINN